MADYDLQYQDTHIDALLATANELKTAGYIYKGVATPSTNPGTPTERVAYLASEPGTYTNFGGIVITSGLYSLTYASGTWTGTQMSAGSDIEVVQTTGQSASDVMSQKAVTDEIDIQKETLQDDTLTSSMAGNLARESDNTFHTTSNRVVILSNLIPEGCTKVSVSSMFTFSVYFANIDSSIVTPYNGQSVVGYKNDTGYLPARRVTCNVPDDSNRVCIQLQTNSISNAVSKTTLTFHIDDGFVNKADVIMGMLETKSLVDTSGYVEYSYWINDAATQWASSSNAHCKIIPVHNDTEYELQVPSGRIRYAFLKTNAIQSGSYPSFCDNYYGQSPDIREDVRIKTPSDCNYLYCLKTTNDVYVIPIIYSIGLKARDFDTIPTQSSDNAVTSGGVYEAINNISYYGVKQVDVLSSITSDMWAKTTWNGSIYSTSNSGSTILLPAETFTDGEMLIKYATSNIAVQLIKVDDGITSLINGTPSILGKNSQYVSATNTYKMQCDGDFNRIAIQIQSSTGTAAGDIERLQSIIVPVVLSDTPINKEVLSDVYNASLDTLRFRFPSYNAVRYPYTGERIFDKTFSVTQMGSGVGNQGSCCYNGVVFGFSSNSTTVKIHDMVTGRITSCSIANMSPNNSHNNAAFFTDEFYDANDPFPIIGTSDDINQNVLLFRIVVNNNIYSMTLVQTIHIEKGETAFSQGNTYTYGNGKLFSLSENRPRTHWYIYEWDMPTLSQGDVTLTSSLENEHRIPEVNNYQGLCYKDGYMFMPEKTSNSNIIVVNMATDEIVTHIPISNVISAEIEDTWFYYDKLYFTTNAGLIYKIDFY
jgi:hypothetical protein